MLVVQFTFNLSYIVHRRASGYRNFVLKELRKLIGFPRAASEDVCVTNILQNSERFLSSWHVILGKILLRKADSKATKCFVRCQ